MKIRFAASAPTEDLYAMLDATRFNLIVIGQPPLVMPASWARLVKIHEIPSVAANGPALAQARIPSRSFFLLRPDGYVGLAGTSLDEAALQFYWRDRLAAIS